MLGRRATDALQSGRFPEFADGMQGVGVCLRPGQGRSVKEVLIDRRSLLRSGAGLSVAATAALFAGPVLAEPAASSTEDPLSFVTADMSTRDVAALLYDDASTAEADAYVDLANGNYPELDPREQLRSILRSDGAPQAGQSAAVAPMALPLAGIAARALIAAAKRYGPAAFRSLKSAVAKGYKAFEAWIDEHKFAGGIIVGVAGSAVYDALKTILF